MLGGGDIVKDKFLESQGQNVTAEANEKQHVLEAALEDIKK